MQNWVGLLKPRPNALDLSLYNARHSCIVTRREPLATLYSEVNHVLLCRVKFDQGQNFALYIVLSRAFGQPLYKVGRAHAQFHHETCQIFNAKFYFFVLIVSVCKGFAEYTKKDTILGVLASRITTTTGLLRNITISRLTTSHRVFLFFKSTALSFLSWL